MCGHWSTSNFSLSILLWATLYQRCDKFKFEYDNVRTLNVFNRFKIWQCCMHFVVECKFVEKNPCSTTTFICTESQRAQTNLFFSQFQPITQTTVMECATWFLLSDILHCTNINTEFINFRLLQSFIWPKPLHYVPTDKIIASICIHIRQIWKVEICIQQMRILTSFGTSLPYIQPRHKCCDNVQIWQISAVCYFLQRFKQVISRQICSV